jgi:hypothetical protein
MGIETVNVLRHKSNNGDQAIAEDEKECLSDLLIEEFTPRDTEQNAYMVEAFRRGREYGGGY